VEVDCGGATTSAEVADRVRAELDTRADEHLHLRVGLTGEVDPECEVDVVALLSVGDGKFAELRIEDSTKPGYDLDHLAEQQTVQGIFVRRLREQIENAEDEGDRAVLESALTAGLRALDGRKDLVHVD
jgi:hypothetical protein